MADLPKDGDWPSQQLPLTQAPPKLIAFLYRLLRDGASAPGDVENHAIQAQHSEDRDTRYTNPHILAYAGSLAASLLVHTAEVRGGRVTQNAAVMTGDQFRELLRDLMAGIEEGDSMEGSLAYEWGDRPGVYSVNAALRVGNAEGGQGGVRIINSEINNPAAG